MRTRLLSTEPKAVEQYRGITMHADTGLHAQAAALVQRYAAAGARVLDIGAGAGAFSRRLGDLGYQVTAYDVDPAKWAATEVPFHVLDLNQGLAHQVDGTCDALCCLEVIEHVENPWALLREFARVVRPGGHLVLSTPNTTSFLSRWTFLRHGRFHQFGDDDLAYGHIRPITAWELRHVAGSTGWRVLETRPGGYLPLLDFSRLAPRALLSNIPRLVTWLLARGETQGWCLLLALERTSD